MAYAITSHTVLMLPLDRSSTPEDDLYGSERGPRILSRSVKLKQDEG